MVDVRGLEGVGDALAEQFIAADLDVDGIATRNPNAVADAVGISPKEAAEIISQARDASEREFGFTTGGNVEPGDDLSAVDILENVAGWEIVVEQPTRVGWESPSGYGLVVEGPTNRVWGQIPDEDTDQPDQVTIRTRFQDHMDSPEAAVEWAAEWFENHPVAPSELTEYTGIGDRTGEYLQLVYDIKTGDDLFALLREDRETLKAIVGAQYFEDLEADLESEFEST